MKFNNRHNECVEHEGNPIWLSRSVAVVSQVIFRKFFKKDGGFSIDYVLLVKRHANSYPDPGKWCMPCGFLDWDETTKEAAIREVWEETGLNLLELKEKEGVQFLGGGLFEDDPWKVTSDPEVGRQSVVIHYAAVFSGWELPTLSIANAEPNEVAETRWEMRIKAGEMDLAFHHDEQIDDFIFHRQALCIRENSCELNTKHREMLEDLVKEHGHNWSANTYYHLRGLCSMIWGSEPVAFERVLKPLLKIANSEYEQLVQNLDKEGLINRKKEIFDYLVANGLSAEYNAHGWGELAIVLSYSSPSGQTNVVIQSAEEAYVGCMCLGKEGKTANSPEEVLMAVKETMRHACIPWGG